MYALFRHPVRSALVTLAQELHLPFAFLAESCQPVEQRHAASVRGNGEVLLGSRIEGTERVSLERGRRAVDLGTIDAMTATQETLRKQLADMRENLARVSENKLRSRYTRIRCIDANLLISLKMSDEIPYVLFSSSR